MKQKQKKEFKEWYVREMKKGKEGAQVTLIKNVVPMRTAYALHWSLYFDALLVALFGITRTSTLILIVLMSLAVLLLAGAILVRRQMKEAFLSSRVVFADVSAEEAEAEAALPEGVFNGTFEELRAMIDAAPKVPASKADEVIGNED